MSCFPKKNDVEFVKFLETQDVTVNPHCVLTINRILRQHHILCFSPFFWVKQRGSADIPQCISTLFYATYAVVFESTEDNIGCFEEKVCKNTRMGKKNKDSGC